jgi:hypothetical protein
MLDLMDNGKIIAWIDRSNANLDTFTFLSVIAYIYISLE